MDKLTKIKETRKRADNKRKNDPVRRAYMKELGLQPKHVKKKTIYNWKKRGVISEDYDCLYDKYLIHSNCDKCEIEFDKSKKSTSKCLDHDHDTGGFRNILCSNCNLNRNAEERKIRGMKRTENSKKIKK